MKRAKLVVAGVVAALGLVWAPSALADFTTVSVTPATGGSSISADTAKTGGTNSGTSLTGPSLTETSFGDITGSVTLSIPSGFEFKGTSATCNGAGQLAAHVSSETTTTIVCTIDTPSSSTPDVLTFAGVSVVPTLGTPLASGNLTLDHALGNAGAVTEVAGAFAKLGFTTQPVGDVARDTALSTQPVVQTQDQFGNATTDNAVSVTLTVSGAVVASDTAATNASGVATFSGVAINKSGTGLVLHASGGGKTGDSSGFNVFGVKTTAGGLVITTPATQARGVNITTVTITLKRDDGTTATDSSEQQNVSVAIKTGNTAGDQSGVSLSGGGSTTTASGTKTFTLQLNKSGTGFILTGSGAGLTSADTSAFDVTGVGSIVFGTQPSKTGRGSTMSNVTVLVKRDDGSSETVLTPTITLTRSSGGASGVVISNNSVAASSGTATFSSLAFDKSGTAFILQASDGATHTDLSSGFDITGVKTTAGGLVVSSPSSPQGRASDFSVTITLKRDDGTTATDSSEQQNVSVAIKTGNTAGDQSGVSLSGGGSTTTASGTTTFTLQLNKSGTGFILTGSGAGLTSADTSAFDVTGVGSIVFGTQPSKTARDGTMSNVTVLVKRDDGTSETVLTPTITLTRSSGGASGVVISNNSVAASSGTATFSSLAFDKSGTAFILQASDGASHTDLSSAFDITGVKTGAGGLAISTPATQARGVNITTVTITLKRDDGTTATDSSEQQNVSVAIKTGNTAGDQSGVSLSGGGSTTTASGTKTFTLQLNKSGTGFILTGSGAGLTSADTSAFDVTGVGSIVFGTQPSKTGRGSTMSNVTVLVKRDDGSSETVLTPTITLTRSSGGASGVVISNNSVAASSGTATFSSLAFDKSGTAFILQASDGATHTDLSSGFDITGVKTGAGGLVITTPTTQARGVNITTVTITLKRDDGTTATDSSEQQNVSVAIKTGNTAGDQSGVSLSGGGSTTTASGTTTFTLQLNKSGTGFILTGSGAGLTSADTSAFDVTGVKTSAGGIVISTPGTSPSRGNSFGTVTITLKRDDGSTATDSSEQQNVSVAIKTGNTAGDQAGVTLSGGGSTLTSGGTTTFTLTINKSGTGFILTGSGAGLTSADTSAFDVTGVKTGAGGLVISTPGTSPSRGNSFGTVTITLKRDDGSTATDSSEQQNVSVAIKTGNTAGDQAGVTLTGGGAAITSAGAHTFALTVNKSGTGFILTGSGAGLTSADTSAFDVTGVKTGTGGLVITTPGTSARGVNITTVTISLKRDDGSAATDSSEQQNVSVAIKTGNTAGDQAGVTLSGGGSTVTSGGSKIFTLQLNKSGTGFILTGSGAGLTSADTSPFDVTGVGSIAFGTQPSKTVRGATMSNVTVLVKRDDGSSETVLTPTITLTRSSGGASGVVISNNAVPVSGGTATFSSLAFDTSGTAYVLQASDGASHTDLSSSFDITGVGSITVTTPTTTARGSSLGTITVTLKRDDGTTASDSSEQQTVTITIGTNPGSATLGGTTSHVTAAGTFAFTGNTLNKSGNGYVLHASDGTNGANTSAFLVTGVGSMTITTPGTAPAVGGSFTLTVTLKRDDGSTADQASEQATVTLTVGTNPGSATLSGTASHATASGTYAFTGLSLNNSGNGYVIHATDGTNTADTNAFNVAGIATTVTLGTSASGSVKTGETFTLTATVSNSSATGTVTFYVGGTALGTANVVAGVATLTTSLSSIGVNQALTAVYNGDSTYAASPTSNTVTQTVTIASTSTALQQSAVSATTGATVTFTATVTATAPGGGTPTGTVSFYDGTTLLGTVSLNGSGVATLTLSTLTVGTHTITAVYNGTTDYATSTSSSVTQTTNAPSTPTPPASKAPPVPPAPVGGASTSVAANQGGTVALPPPAPSTDAASPPVEVAVTWTPGTISVPAAIVVAPATAPSTGGFQAGSSAIEITVKAADGTMIKSFATPLAITFTDVPVGFVPTTSDDGITWRAIPLMPGDTLPDGWTDGYVRHGATIIIYTRHLSIFAVQRKLPAFVVRASALLLQGQKALVVKLKTNGVTHVTMTLYDADANVMRSWHRWFTKGGDQTLKLYTGKLKPGERLLTLVIEATGSDGRPVKLVRRVVVAL